MKKSIKSGLLSVAAAFLVAIQPATADTLRFQDFAYGSVTSTIWENVPGTAVTTTPAAGGFEMRNLTAGGSFVAWCVDIFNTLNTSNSGSSYSLVSGNTFYPASPKVAALEMLASQRLASVNTATESAAFQLAVWEIATENQSASYGYDLLDGNFRVTSNNAARTLANTWLSQLGNSYSGPMLQLSIWSSQSSQDLAVFTPAIPEPEVYAMMIAGLGLMGFVARRRKKAE